MTPILPSDVDASAPSRVSDMAVAIADWLDSYCHDLREGEDEHGDPLDYEASKIEAAANCIRQLLQPHPNAGQPVEPAPGAGEDAEREADISWRNLALQFDSHRMTALGWLRAVVAGEAEINDIRDFLAAPPLSGEKVLAYRIAAIARSRAGEDAEREAETDWQEEVGKAIMTLPPGYRSGGLLAGIRKLRSEFDALSRTRQPTEPKPAQGMGEAMLDAFDNGDPNCEACYGLGLQGDGETPCACTEQKG